MRLARRRYQTIDEWAAAHPILSWTIFGTIVGVFGWGIYSFGVMLGMFLSLLQVIL